MLAEIRCTEFKSDGKSRNPIIFSPGLNTVLGDQVGTNSIGKSTFLMIVDFVFGGNDYIEKSIDVQQQIGQHLIQFAFRFDDRLYYFSRDTVAYDRVNKCSAEYQIIENISIKEFRKFLSDGYNIGLPLLSFRDMVSRYFRIYGRDNLDEKNPLHSVPQERKIDAINALLKLFNLYAHLYELKDALKKAEEKKDAYNKSVRFNFIQKITQGKYIQNERQIAAFQAQLEQIVAGKKSPEQDYLVGLELEDARRISTIKAELANLRRQRSRLESKLELIQRNMDSNIIDFQDDFSDLQIFFPSIEIRKIQEIEGFHKKLQNILRDEFIDEKQLTETQLEETRESILKNEAIIAEENIPEEVTKKQLDEYADINKQIEILKQENSSYQQLQELRESVKTIGQQLESQQSGSIRELQNTISNKMKELNDIIYDGQKQHPILTLYPDGKNYIFETPHDTGTGTSYKALVVFDLSILALTPLPALVHDSVVLKQIADAPLEKILGLYQKSGKQIFIALDKGGSYTRRTEEILEQTAVLRLSDNGNELFGRSWNIKDPRP
ncbi:MAG: DUF2326 domain-containing protein [Dysgonamonadaceae bacterium]|jgi:hypothetical protein|nr:DUF2326 domain-containing protein [Dysgonamonadaceae bacterium]